jgi:hypothetical protein
MREEIWGRCEGVLPSPISRRNQPTVPSPEGFSHPFPKYDGRRYQSTCRSHLDGRTVSVVPQMEIFEWYSWELSLRGKVVIAASVEMEKEMLVGKVR